MIKKHTIIYLPYLILAVQCSIFTWSHTGERNGDTCVLISVYNIDPWTDNYLCSNTVNLSSWMWSNIGYVDNMQCIDWSNSSTNWDEAWLCFPYTDEVYVYSNTLILEGDCVFISEPDDYQFTPFYLCHMSNTIIDTCTTHNPLSVVYANNLYNIVIRDVLVYYHIVYDSGYIDVAKLIPYITTSHLVCATEFLDKLYIFYNNNNGINTISYITYDGNTWSDIYNLNIFYTINNPSCISNSNTLMLVYQSKCSRVQVVDEYKDKYTCAAYPMYSYYDGNTWTLDLPIDGYLSLTSMYCSMYLNSIFCFFIDNHDAHGLSYIIYNMEVWSSVHSTLITHDIDSSMSLSVLDENLYVFYKDTMNSLIYIHYDGMSWSIVNTNVNIYNSPSVSNHNDKLYVLYRNADMYTDCGYMSILLISNNELIDNIPMTSFPSLSYVMTGDPQYPWCDNVDIPECNISSDDYTKKYWSEKYIQTQYYAVWKQLNYFNDMGYTYIGATVNGDLTAFGHDWQLSKYRDILSNHQSTEWYLGLGNHDYSNNVDNCFDNICATRMVMFMNTHIKKYPNKDVSYYYDNGITFITGSFAYSYKIASYRFINLQNYPDYTNNIGSAFYNGDPVVIDVTSSRSWLASQIRAASASRDIIIINYHDGGNIASSCESQWDSTDFESFLDRTCYASSIDICLVYNSHCHNLIGRSNKPVGIDTDRELTGSATYKRFILGTIELDKANPKDAVVTNYICYSDGSACTLSDANNCTTSL